ncbi:hypothetical protein B0T13DRAFT_312859 [Neurospora crassa]|nr:hypothetical protein B0T13DRAFT_312859 [Neurospora crassa]
MCSLSSNLRTGLTTCPVSGHSSPISCLTNPSSAPDRGCTHGTEMDANANGNGVDGWANWGMKLKAAKQRQGQGVMQSANWLTSCSICLPEREMGSFIRPSRDILTSKCQNSASLLPRSQRGAAGVYGWLLPAGSLHLRPAQFAIPHPALLLLLLLSCFFCLNLHARR